MMAGRLGVAPRLEVLETTVLPINTTRPINSGEQAVRAFSFLSIEVSLSYTTQWLRRGHCSPMVRAYETGPSLWHPAGCSGRLRPCIFSVNSRKHYYYATEQFKIGQAKTATYINSASKVCWCPCTAPSYLDRMVDLTGFAPATLCLPDRCSPNELQARERDALAHRGYGKASLKTGQHSQNRVCQLWCGKSVMLRHLSVGNAVFYYWTTAA